MDEITFAIACATDRIQIYRIAYLLNKKGLLAMPPLIEIRGLGASVAAAKKGIADVRSETTGLSVDASALIAAVQDVRTQIKEAHADLKFEAETLGNSEPQSSQPSGSVAPTEQNQ